MGAAFVKTCAYAPFPVWIYLNGHEWAKRQATRRRLAFEAPDYGVRATADAAALPAICNRLSAREVWRFFNRWQARLPSPLPPRTAAAATATSSRSGNSSCPNARVRPPRGGPRVV